MNSEEYRKLRQFAYTELSEDKRDLLMSLLEQLYGTAVKIPALLKPAYNPVKEI